MLRLNNVKTVTLESIRILLCFIKLLDKFQFWTVSVVPSRNAFCILSGAFEPATEFSAVTHILILHIDTVDSDFERERKRERNIWNFLTAVCLNRTLDTIWSYYDLLVIESVSKWQLKKFVYLKVIRNSHGSPYERRSGCLSACLQHHQVWRELVNCFQIDLLVGGLVILRRYEWILPKFGVAVFGTILKLNCWPIAIKNEFGLICSAFWVPPKPLCEQCAFLFRQNQPH